MSKVVFMVGDVISDSGSVVRVEEVHAVGCGAAEKRIKSFYGGFNFEVYESVAAAEADYNEDIDELGWVFADEVKVHACAKK